MYEGERIGLGEYDIDSIWEYAPQSLSREEAVLEYQYATSPEGYGSLDFCGIYRLADGYLWSFDGWTDTTGWGCQEDVRWYGPYRTVWGAMSDLSQEHRRALGFEGRVDHGNLFRD